MEQAFSHALDRSLKGLLACQGKLGAILELNNNIQMNQGN